MPPGVRGPFLRKKESVMAATLTRKAAGTGKIERLMRAGGLQPREWSDSPGALYGWHAHEYPKVLYCAGGSIVFHTRDGDLPMEPGDRLELEPGTEHAATVGPGGVTCFEAWLIE